MEGVPVPWHELSESAQASVVWWIRRMAEGASARICFDCSEGGVRAVTEEVVMDRYEDGSRRICVRNYSPDELDDAA